MKPTSEQEAILASIHKSTSHLMINALAGTGKTSTLKMGEVAINSIQSHTPILYLVFNTANAKSAIFKASAPAEEKSKRMSISTEVKTFNSFGYGVWRNTVSASFTVDGKKNRELLSAHIKSLKNKAHRDEVSDSFWEILTGVALAKSLGYVPKGWPQAKPLTTKEDFHNQLDEAPSEVVAESIDEILSQSIQAAYRGSLDFDDQVYMPAVFGGPYSKFSYVFIDEYQDLNPCNHAMVHRLLSHSRGIGVGDPWQSIYAFRGAKRGGMSQAITTHSMNELNLSVSFRCPQRVVEAARWRVPHFNWIKEGGHVDVLDELHWDDVADDAVFICRNNAPLFRLAMRSLMSGRSVNVSGSDIGPRVVGIMRKLGPESSTRTQVLDLINQWEADKIQKGSKVAPDMAACMRVFASSGNSLSHAIAHAEHLFAQSGLIRMMTGHKAKGQEFEEVYFLDSYLCREDEQDQNLRYVIQTRSANLLHYIDSERITFNAN